jgi:hypothetical protein
MIKPEPRRGVRDRELKKRRQIRMLKKKVPTRLWDYGLAYESNILNRIPGSFAAMD